MVDGGMVDGGWRMADGGWQNGGWGMGDGGWQNGGWEIGGRQNGGWGTADGGWGMGDGRLGDGGWRMVDGDGEQGADCRSHAHWAAAEVEPAGPPELIPGMGAASSRMLICPHTASCWAQLPPHASLPPALPYCRGAHADPAADGEEAEGAGSVGGDAATWVGAVGVCRGADIVVSALGDCSPAVAVACEFAAASSLGNTCS